jgi:hypothetical protein
VFPGDFVCHDHSKIPEFFCAAAQFFRTTINRNALNRKEQR